MHRRNTTQTTRRILQYAKYNRKIPTDAKKILWMILRRHTLLGNKFRRQHAIADFIVDFVCIEKKLVVELDGGYHEDSEQYTRDQARSSALKKLGYRVVRFTNSQVFYKREAVINSILMYLEGRDEEVGEA